MDWGDGGCLRAQPQSEKSSTTGNNHRIPRAREKAFLTCPTNIIAYPSFCSVLFGKHEDVLKIKYLRFLCFNPTVVRLLQPSLARHWGKVGHTKEEALGCYFLSFYYLASETET